MSRARTTRRAAQKSVASVASVASGVSPTTGQTPKQAENSTVFGQAIPPPSAPLPITSLGGTLRESEPARWTPYTGGGLGIIARRAVVDPLFASTTTQMEQFAGTQPMRLLSLLPDIHPGVGLALWNALRLSCPVDGFEVAAVKTAGNDTNEEPDEVATKSLRDMWNSQPAEIGGLAGFQTQLTIQALFTGLAASECVPGSALSGIKRVWPVDSLTLSFGRQNRDADVQPYQRQIHPQLAPQGSALGSGPAPIPFPFSVAIYGAQYVPMSVDRFFWVALDQQVDDPYGRAPYATALSEVLADLALMQDLRDAVHNSAWPRMEVGVDMSALHKVAVEVYRISDPKKATEWVNSRFKDIVAYVENLKSSDNIVHDSSGSVKTMQPGGFQGLEGVMSFLRNRLVQAVKTLPTLMGISEGATNFNSVEWTIYAEGLETLRAIIADLIIKVCNLHLRLIGSTSVAVARYEKIRTNDSLVEANTLAVQIANATNLEKLGYITHDQGSLSVVGHEAAAEAQPGVIKALLEPMSGPATTPVVTGKGEMSKPGEKKIPQNPNTSDSTKEERQAKKQIKSEYVIRGGTGKWYSHAA